MLLQEVELTFAYHYWLKYDATHGEDRVRLRREFTAFHSACFLTSLLSIRKINDFFSPASSANRKRSDDLKASQFGFAKMESVLDKREIDKLVAHLTERGEELRIRGMPITDMVVTIHERCLEFFDYLEESLLDRRILADRQMLSRISELRASIHSYRQTVVAVTGDTVRS